MVEADPGARPTCGLVEKGWGVGAACVRPRPLDAVLLGRRPVWVAAVMLMTARQLGVNLLGVVA